MSVQSSTSHLIRIESCLYMNSTSRGIKTGNTNVHDVGPLALNSRYDDGVTHDLLLELYFTENFNNGHVTFISHFARLNKLHSMPSRRTISSASLEHLGHWMLPLEAYVHCPTQINCWSTKCFGFYFHGFTRVITKYQHVSMSL